MDMILQDNEQIEPSAFNSAQTGQSSGLTCPHGWHVLCLGGDWSIDSHQASADCKNDKIGLMTRLVTAAEL